MRFFFLIFLILVSCSSDLVYNESKPHIFVEAGFYRVPSDNFLRNSDTLPAGSYVQFKASIDPDDYYDDYYWMLNSQKYPFRRDFQYELDTAGVYTADFYVIDFLGDVFVKNSTIVVYE
jgi:hypothetical protein